MSPHTGCLALVACLALTWPATADEKQACTDLHGDPLPAGAITRLGTVRLRHAAQMFVFSPDGRFLAVAGAATRLFDAATGKPLRRFDSPANYVAFSGDSKTLFTTTYLSLLAHH